ncbi:MAG: outer membrane beta-barrel protein [Tannerellaceae bacterium]
MKKINKSLKLLALLFACLAMPTVADAQLVKSMYANIDWQLNTPVGNDFADKTSGWGVNAEAGYYFQPSMSIGGFVSYHTNNRYVDRQTMPVTPTSSVTSDQQHSLFQLPFGAALRYTFNRQGLFEPYVGVKLGANYSEMSTYLNVLKLYDRTWGFYAAPELGMTVFFTPEKKFGIHFAAYYNYATNKSEVLTYKIDGMSNCGIRLGAAF